MNTFIINNKTYYFESVWRDNKNDKTRDSVGNLLPFPSPGKGWSNKENFNNILYGIKIKLDKKDRYIFKEYPKPKDCLICGKKRIGTKLYKYLNYVWEDSLNHYIEEHNIEPSEKFIDTIYLIVSTRSNSYRINMKGDIINNEKVVYVKLDKNQIMIIDALMYHGGYTKKYYDKTKNEFKYSEHAGLLDFNGKYLDRIIVSGNTNRTDIGDSDIYLPSNMDDAIQYEYLFHTHPPTPKPGGRASDGILYEFPSIGDILHFIDHFNDGKTIGSLVVTPEGMYNIRKLELNTNKIKIDEDNMFKAVSSEINKIQDSALEIYGTTFSTYQFYSSIAQDTTYISRLNKILETFGLHIDFFPRKRDNKGKWIIDSIYLPIYK